MSEQERQTWDRVLTAARSAHQRSPAMKAFCPFPDDVTPQAVEAFHIPAADLLAQETRLHTQDHADLRDASVAAGSFARWRETYKGTDIGQDFMDRFGCYALIGGGGAFTSQQMWAWVVYMPEGLYYPWHHHPGEEMYLVLAGQAEFMAEGRPNEILRPGQTSQHRSNQPHAMQTHDHPVMAMVIWRNGFDTAPVLTE